MIMDENIPLQSSLFDNNTSNSPASHTMGPVSIETPINDEQVLITDDSACCNVYVANLPISADATVIRQLFEPIGKVLHVKLLLDIASGLSRGIAFVMFENITVARKACVVKNKAVLDGSVLQVRLAERSSLHSSPNAHVRSSVVYIRNIPGNITHDMVKKFCEEKFGPVVEVSPHPQSAELKGPSPFNMDFVVFQSVDDACRCVEGVDGRATFPLPPSHPFTMAKMITDVAGEMRKSILLRRRSSENTAARRNSGGLPTKTVEQRQNIAPQQNMLQMHAPQVHQLPVNPQFQPFVQSYVSNPYHSQPMPTMYQPLQQPQSPMSVPFFDSQRQSIGGSMSQRSSIDASMLQSHRGSMIMLNTPQGIPQPYMSSPDTRGPIPTHHSAPMPVPQYYQRPVMQPQIINQPIMPQQMMYAPMMYPPMSGH